jgi:hypothetical protein
MLPGPPGGQGPCWVLEHLGALPSGNQETVALGAAGATHTAGPSDGGSCGLCSGVHLLST